MITLITGVPGMGKTALLVSMLMELEIKAERPIFVMGIPDLKIEHVKCPPVEEWTEQRPDPDDPSLMLDYFCFPANAVLVVDEAQRTYRPRSSASKVPAHVAALETHRHTGIDIILLTQKPKLIDINVRELVGRHIHIRNGFMGRWLYESPHIFDGESRVDRGDAIKRRFKPPKKAFQRYKSAEVHTSPSFRFNFFWLYLVGALGAFAYTASNAYSVVNKGMNGDKPAQAKPADKLAAKPKPISAAPSMPQAMAVALSLTEAEQHPFDGHRFSILGTYEMRKQKMGVFRVSNESSSVNMSSKNLIELGYSVEIVNSCFAFITHGKSVIPAKCEESEVQVQRAAIQPRSSAAETPPILSHPVIPQEVRSPT